MKARTDKLIGTIVVAMSAAGVLAGGALAQPTPDWVERAAGAGTSTVSTASATVPVPDWVDRAATGKRAGGGRVATKSIVISPPDWVERTVKRSRAGTTQLTAKSTGVLVTSRQVVYEVERVILV